MQIGSQLKQKHQLIKQQKQQKRQAQQMNISSPKIKKFTISSSKSNVSGSNNGFANTLVLSLIVSFVFGALVMVAYMIIRK